MQREFPVDPDSPLFERKAHVPADPFQALMETAPGDEPAISQLELLGVRELLADAIDQLEDIEQWVVTRSVIERWPIRRIAKVLAMPKSTAFDLRNRSLAKLRAVLSQDPTVQRLLDL